MLVDEVKIHVIAGHGGPGKVSFYPGLKSGPDGGNGGKGGDVYIKAISDMTALRRFLKDHSIAAENGKAGMSNRKFGHKGKDIELEMPVGSIIKDIETGEQVELTKVGQMFVLCKGGIGGLGNFELKSSRRTTPEFAQPGLPGEEKRIEVTLKLIADYGLIGLPNAGKSSLLNELTNANVRVANYPFTTLEANLGVLPLVPGDSDNRYLNPRIIADIPGLIEGASSGKGLGIKFLKHIEKTSELLHCISADSDDPIKDYKTIRNELEEYSFELMNKKEIILLTKSDLVDPKTLKLIISKLKKLKREIIPVSIYDYESIEKLKKLL